VSDCIAQRATYVHVGMDVHRDWISTGVLRPGSDEVAVDKVFHDEPSVRRLVRQLGDPSRVWACYEAGPTGYGLARLLESMGVRCEVIAPSLIPKTPGDRVKTDRRDCRKLARLHRAGELTAIRIPTPEEEAVRDVCRARADAVEDLRRARQRLGMFLLRHGRVWRDGQGWTAKHWRWVRAQQFNDAALTATLAHYRGVVEAREATLRAVDGELAGWFDRDPFAEAVARLAAYRGITELGGLVLASEVGDWRRFATAGRFMGAVGLVPSEYSSGGSVSRGSITKAGNGHVRDQLVEAAWAYQHRPAVGATLQRRQQRCGPQTVARSWKAQQRLCARFRQLTARKHIKTVVATAVARELAGFVWAEMTADD
jgi:transposase